MYACRETYYEDLARIFMEADKPRGPQAADRPGEPLFQARSEGGETGWCPRSEQPRGQSPARRGGGVGGAFCFGLAPVGRGPPARGRVREGTLLAQLTTSAHVGFVHKPPPRCPARGLRPSQHVRPSPAHAGTRERKGKDLPRLEQGG